MQKPQKDKQVPTDKNGIPADVNKIEVKFTDMELQYVASNLVRKQRIIDNVNLQFAEEMQHFGAMVARKKNIQWDDTKFKGVAFDTEKQKCYLLIAKD